MLKLNSKHWTVIGILTFITLFASAMAGGEYIAGKTVKPYIHNIAKQSAEKVCDSAIQPLYCKYNKVFFAVQKSQTFIEASMNEETRNVAESRWHHDSAIIQTTLDRDK